MRFMLMLLCSLISLTVAPSSVKRDGILAMMKGRECFPSSVSLECCKLAHMYE